jgi:hypothetical protein
MLHILKLWTNLYNSGDITIFIVTSRTPKVIKNKIKIITFGSPFVLTSLMYTKGDYNIISHLLYEYSIKVTLICDYSVILLLIN